MNELRQSIQAPDFRQSSHYFDVVFDLKDAEGSEIDFQNGWGFELEVVNYFTRALVFARSTPNDILIVPDPEGGSNAACNFSTENIMDYVVGAPYRATGYLTDPTGKRYPRLYFTIYRTLD